MKSRPPQHLLPPPADLSNARRGVPAVVPDRPRALAVPLDRAGESRPNVVRVPFSLTGHWGRASKIGGAMAALFLLLLAAVNFILPTDWLEARVAAHIKEQTGRDLAVNGTTRLYFMPWPRIVISDAKMTQPAPHAASSELSVAKLKADFGLAGLFSKHFEPERLVLVRPVLTVWPDGDTRRQDLADAGDEPEVAGIVGAEAEGVAPASPKGLRFGNIDIEDGTLVVASTETGEWRVEQINAALAQPEPDSAVVGSGSFAWKSRPAAFSFEIASPAALNAGHATKLIAALDAEALGLRFDGTLAAAPSLAGQGTLSATTHSIPGLLTWVGGSTALSGAVGNGELFSEVSWSGVSWYEGEISFSKTRFALDHASGEGEAVLALTRPRPHLRAALAIDHLDLNPLLESSVTAAPAKPELQDTAVLQLRGPTHDLRSTVAPEDQNSIAQPQDESGNKTARPSKNVSSAVLDADINLNVLKTHAGGLDIGPSSLNVAIRDGVIEGSFGSTEFYGGEASATMLVDATAPVPTFTGKFQLEDVEAQPLLNDAARFDMVVGLAKLKLEITAEGGSAAALKSSLRGTGSVVVSDGAIEGIDAAAFIEALGGGNLNIRQDAGAKTAFSDFGGSFTIADGIAETHSLKMMCPQVNVIAEGTVDLMRSDLDIMATPEFVARAQDGQAEKDLAGLALPIRIEGALAAPHIQPQIERVFANSESASKTVAKISAALRSKPETAPVAEGAERTAIAAQSGEPEQGDGNTPVASELPAEPEAPANGIQR